ncbi:hypothetical protein ACIO3R_25005 [Streptomyces sp. NPDC087428]|uniref:MmyB family transcriptional regulator n=1 Tax=Streptomyces sp. NPDC087428 TaxID=3365788 RepID=UPI00382DC4DF
MIFLDPFAREFHADWEQAARIAVGNLRASSSQFPQDGRIERIVGELSVRQSRVHVPVGALRGPPPHARRQTLPAPTGG